jgi:hypothetical protein
MDLIQNVDTLFDECPSPSPPIPSPDVPETTSTPTVSSPLLTPEFPRSAGVQATSSAGQHHPGLVDAIPEITQSSFSSLLSDTALESCLTASPTPSNSPYSDSRRHLPLRKERRQLRKSRLYPMQRLRLQIHCRIVSRRCQGFQHRSRPRLSPSGGFRFRHNNLYNQRR